MMLTLFRTRDIVEPNNVEIGIQGGGGHRESTVAKGNYLGEFEQIVMLALARVGEGAYGVPVHEEILTTTGRDVSIASVYVTLSRLDRKGLVRSTHERRDQARGRPRRFFTLTQRGWRALRHSRATLDVLWDGVEVRDNSR